MTNVRWSRPWRDEAADRIEDLALLLVLVLTAPLVILLIGMPIVLCLRAAIEIVGRFSLCRVAR